MQTKAKIVLNPAYKGPVVIEEYLRKIKSNSSLGRMISNFNKRFFVLDFRHMKFYYLPERGAQLSTATDIQLESITRIYIDNQLGMLDDEQIWKYGFVILSGKRSYRLISYARTNMESILYALAHLTNTETGQPLFDWNEYKTTQENDPMRGSEPLRPQIFSPAAEEKEKEGKVSRSDSNEIKREVRASSNERQEAQQSPEKSERQIRKEQEEREQEEEEERRERKANAYKVKDQANEESRERSNEVCRDKEGVRGQSGQKYLKSEVDSVGLCESQVVTAEESIKEREQTREFTIVAENREVSERKVGSVRAKVEVLRIDSEENVVIAPRNNAVHSARNNPHVRRDSNKEWEPTLASPKSSFGGRPMAKAKRSSEEEIGSGRVNEVETVQSKKKSDDWDTNEKPVQNNRDYMQQNEQEQRDQWSNPRDTAAKKVQENNGWGVEEVKPKQVQNVKKNVVEDDDDWDKDMESPPKKNEKKLEVKANGWANETNNRSVPSHIKSNVVKKVDDDDDWDKEMESPPRKSGKTLEIKDNSWAKKEIGYKAQDNGWGSEANNRSVPSHIKSNVVKKVDDDDDWDKDMESPPRKSGKTLEAKDNSWAKKETGYKAQGDDWGSNAKSNAIKKANNDYDDWDSQSKRLDVRTEYRNSVQNSGYGAVGVNKVAKNAEFGGYTQKEVPVTTKATAHNDWDDDL